MQNSDNFRLNEAAPFVEEENLEEVGEEANELDIDEEVRELMAIWDAYVI